VPETETVRIEVGFDGGQIMSALVTADSADAFERALREEGPPLIALDADDGRYTILLRRVLYLKRYAREARVGFEL
jgi:hypothetical protein